jgi:hypothetical protein
MEGSTFDRLARAVSTAGSRRRLLGVLASVGLGGLLSQLDDASTEAKRKRHGRRRSHRPGKHKDNRKGKRKGGKGIGGGQCGTTGSDCSQDSDCCANNCFDFACAEKVRTCGTGDTAKQCLPPAKGCAGETCCYGPLACGDRCCDAPANQCNPQGACCAPNCADRQCGDDGCGAGGTCGSCSADQTCDDATGQCVSTCSAQTCPDGCCDAAGRCQLGFSRQACGKNGEACQECASGQTCLANSVCGNVAGTCTTSVATCGNNLHSPCNSNDLCTCDLTIDGTQVCRATDVHCGVSCNSNADCGAGRVCVPCVDCAPANKACVTVC